jgi:hypothetical protein
MTDQTLPPKTVRVRLPHTSHLQRVGNYARGEIVAVSPADAERLITTKGFERAPPERAPDAIAPTTHEPQEPTP